jgi:hypothetical protein
MVDRSVRENANMKWKKIALSPELKKTNPAEIHSTRKAYSPRWVSLLLSGLLSDVFDFQRS